MSGALCGTCGMAVDPAEFHPYAACLMFMGCRDGDVVRANLQANRTPAGMSEPDRIRHLSGLMSPDEVRADPLFREGDMILVWVNESDWLRALTSPAVVPEPAAESLAPEQYAKALEHFTEYFVRNYPGPDTIISRPTWHAPRIFRAALYALSAAAPAAVREPETQGHPAVPPSEEKK